MGVFCLYTTEVGKFCVVMFVALLCSKSNCNHSVHINRKRNQTQLISILKWEPDLTLTIRTQEMERQRLRLNPDNRTMNRNPKKTTIANQTDRWGKNVPLITKYDWIHIIKFLISFSDTHTSLTALVHTK